MLRRGRRKRANPCGIKSFCARTDPDTYLFKHVPKSLLPQGSAACVARRFRPFLWFERAMKFAKMLHPYKTYPYGEHPSSHSSSKMLWRRNPRCGTLQGHRLSCEHPAATLSCIMMNPQRGGAFFFAVAEAEHGMQTTPRKPAWTSAESAVYICGTDENDIKKLS